MSCFSNTLPLVDLGCAERQPIGQAPTLDELHVCEYTRSVTTVSFSGSPDVDRYSHLAFDHYLNDLMTLFVFTLQKTVMLPSQKKKPGYYLFLKVLF